MARKKQRLYGNDVEILRELFDKAVKVYGIEGKGILDLQAHHIRLIRDEINECVKTYLESNKNTKADIAESLGRTYEIYVGRIRKALKELPNQEKEPEVKKEDIIENDNGVKYSDAIVNSITLYATKGSFNEWEKYRSAKNKDLVLPESSESNKVKIRKKLSNVEGLNQKKPKSKSSVVDKRKLVKGTQSSKPKQKKVTLKQFLLGIISFSTIIAGVSLFETILSLWEKYNTSELAKPKYEWIKGTTVDEKTGIPISNVKIECNSVFHYTDSIGHFNINIPNASREPYALIIKDDRFAPDTFKIVTSNHINSIPLTQLD